MNTITSTKANTTRLAICAWEATVTGFEFRDGLIRLKKKNENNMKGVARIRVEEDETKRIHMVSLRDFYRLYSRVRVFN